MPKLSKWRRLDVVHNLVAGGEYERDGKCNRTRFKKTAEIHAYRSESGQWRTSGLIKCSRWCCPSCGLSRARKTSSKLGACFRAHMGSVDLYSGSLPDLWMLTLAPPHYADEDTSVAVARLYKACALFWATKAWRQFAERWGIVGRVRVLDATHGGANGSHAHFHVALFPTRAAYAVGEIETKDCRSWHLQAGKYLVPDLYKNALPLQPLRSASQRDRQVFLNELRVGLLPAWEQAVRASGARIEHDADFRKVSLRLSPSERAAAYFLKWGLADEIGKPTAKSRNHLRLLDAVAAGSDVAGDLFLAWRKAVDGKAWVTGLSDVCKRLGIDDDDADVYLDELEAAREKELERAGTPQIKVRELTIELRRHLYGAALSYGLEHVFGFCDEVDARGDDVQYELDSMLAHRRSELPFGYRDTA